jgi:alkylation response protein AidB-like acyl-CoA dehydrogenase
MAVERMICCGELTHVYADAGDRPHAKTCKHYHPRKMDVETFLTEYPERLRRQLKALEATAAGIEQGYGGGGYDNTEAIRIAGKIQGIKIALSNWSEMCQ